MNVCEIWLSACVICIKGKSFEGASLVTAIVSGYVGTVIDTKIENMISMFSGLSALDRGRWLSATVHFPAQPARLASG